MIKLTKYIKTLLIIIIIATPLAAAPVRGLFASINLGCRYTSQNHDYTNNTGAVGKETKGELATSFGLSFGMLNQVEKTKAVVGGEVSISMNQSKANYNLQVSGGQPEGKVEITNPYTFGGYAILGTMMTPKLMFYAKAGYAWVKTTLKYKGLSEGDANYSKTMAGISGGGGANYLITDKIMIGCEYLIHVPGQTAPRDNSYAVGGQKRKFVYHPTIHSVMIRLSMLF
jgi:opacity protein-like surface antigen